MSKAVLFNGSVILYIVAPEESVPSIHECPPVQLLPGAMILFDVKFRGIPSCTRKLTVASHPLCGWHQLPLDRLLERDWLAYREAILISNGLLTTSQQPRRQYIPRSSIQRSLSNYSQIVQRARPKMLQTVPSWPPSDRSSCRSHSRS